MKDPKENGTNGTNGTNGEPAPLGHDPTTGHFLKGNKVRKKTALNSTIRQAREAFRKAVTDEDVAELARKLVARGKKGDIAAIKLVLAYKIGQPQRLDDADTTGDDSVENRLEFM